LWTDGVKHFKESFGTVTQNRERIIERAKEYEKL
jgi:hypothetical protein